MTKLLEREAIKPLINTETLSVLEFAIIMKSIRSYSDKKTADNLIKKLSFML